ncbi:GNAT family N-acetyltransferase [Cellulomonas sp. APG4]|uniref:GNAT family N-acetyltransferase n=1 Tax=Cellulomonas sp. APG4 TaxID=1538656 RepID=UPI001379DA7A|nr:GNAT family N-acetyltransferase [Cellulomonas sp. APG4]NCT90663.1 GNAT family N-acetyltransferase [Cellulomonas sp. APG4]
MQPDLSRPHAPASDAVVVLRTDRLLLRAFGPDDVAAFAAMNADPVVMEHFVRPQTPAETEAFVARIEAHWREHGWGLWALERRDTGAFIGYTGLWPVRFEATFQPRVEVGWRLAAAHWGHGFATEAAHAALDHAFGALGWPEVASFTARGNLRSRAVMERIGMRRDPSCDFEHPAVPVGHPVRPHVFYRIAAGDPRPEHPRAERLRR